jgi:hypothetical protein
MMASIAVAPDRPEATRERTTTSSLETIGIEEIDVE